MWQEIKPAIKHIRRHQIFPKKPECDVTFCVRVVRPTALDGDKVFSLCHYPTEHPRIFSSTKSHNDVRNTAQERLTEAEQEREENERASGISAVVRAYSECGITGSSELVATCEENHATSFV